MAIFGRKPWVNPFGKMSIFRLFKLRLFKGQRAVFSYQSIVKKHFPGLLCFKKKVRKMPILIPKSWVNPFGKMSIFFDYLNFFVLKPRKAFFSFWNIVKTFFWPILPKKKKLEKWPFLDQNHGLTPLEKCQFFDFLNFLFLQLRIVFFRSRIS